MTTSAALLFLSSFIVTYNFTAMQNAMTKTGLALGFYGGIAVLGWFYQVFFMPETKVSFSSVYLSQHETCWTCLVVTCWNSTPWPPIVLDIH